MTYTICFYYSYLQYYRKKYFQAEFMRRVFFSYMHLTLGFPIYLTITANSLATASGYVHLAEPGCLHALSIHSEPCKLSFKSQAGTRSRTGLSSQQVVWTPGVPLGPLLFHERILHPSKCQVTNHSSVDWLGSLYCEGMLLSKYA